MVEVKKGHKICPMLSPKLSDDKLSDDGEVKRSWRTMENQEPAVNEATFLSRDFMPIAWPPPYLNRQMSVPPQMPIAESNKLSQSSPHHSSHRTGLRLTSTVDRQFAARLAACFSQRSVTMLRI